MKPLYLFILFQILGNPLVLAQVYNNGATLKISNGTTLSTDMELTNTNSGTLENEGTLDINNNIQNQNLSLIHI